ncbi:MAG: hypothetical protein ACRETE_05595, partial [Stenotrophobium sp.]
PELELLLPPELELLLLLPPELELLLPPELELLLPELLPPPPDELPLLKELLLQAASAKLAIKTAARVLQILISFIAVSHGALRRRFPVTGLRSHGSAEHPLNGGCSRCVRRKT